MSYVYTGQGDLYFTRYITKAPLPSSGLGYFTVGNSGSGSTYNINITRWKSWLMGKKHTIILAFPNTPYDFFQPQNSSKICIFECTPPNFYKIIFWNCLSWGCKHSFLKPLDFQCCRNIYFRKQAAVICYSQALAFICELENHTMTIKNFHYIKKFIKQSLLAPRQEWLEESQTVVQICLWMGIPHHALLCR